jgi:hypothetical protein
MKCGKYYSNAFSSNVVRNVNNASTTTGVKLIKLPMRDNTIDFIASAITGAPSPITFANSIIPCAKVFAAEGIKPIRPVTSPTKATVPAVSSYR